jgi:hypothetical protein
VSESNYFRKLETKVARIPANEAPPSVPGDDAGVVAAAAQIGFVNRDPDTEPDIETRQTLGPVVMMTMRAPVRVARRFKAFCKVNRMSYWEGIEELLNRAGSG